MIRDDERRVARESTPPGPRACARAKGGADRAQARSAEHGPGVGIVLSSLSSLGALLTRDFASLAGNPSAAPAVSQRDSEEADARFRKGNELYKQRRYAEAEVEYEPESRRASGVTRWSLREPPPRVSRTRTRSGSESGCGCGCRPGPDPALDPGAAASGFAVSGGAG